MMILAIGIVFISLFQAIDNYYSHRRQDREGVTIRDQTKTINSLSSRLQADEDFFAVVRQLIILGPNADAAQRQAIIDELKRQSDARLAPPAPTPASTTTTTVKKALGESTTTVTTRPNSQPSRSTTTTTTGLLPFPSSLVPLPLPPSSLPPVSVCAGNTCVTIPPVTLLVPVRVYEKEEVRRYEKAS